MGLFSPTYRCRLCETKMRMHPHDPVYYCPRCGHRSDERIDESIVHGEDDVRYRPPPRRRPYQQDDRISPMYHNKAKNFSSHRWDVVDNRGYFGKKKRKR